MGYREVDRVGSNPDIIFAPIVPRGGERRRIARLRLIMLYAMRGFAISARSVVSLIGFPGAAQHGAQRNDALQTRDRRTRDGRAPSL